MPKASKKRVKSAKIHDRKRKQRSFSTSSAFMPVWVSVVGMLGCFLLGGGVFGTWILDPALTWASYLVAAGGLGLGLALWFGQPPEVAVAVGDGGIAVDSGQQTQRLRWYEIRAIRTVGGRMVVEGTEISLKFLIGANKSATAYLLKEAAERTPHVIDVAPGLTRSLPRPDKVGGLLQGIEDDQVTGTRCAASEQLIHLEEDARICSRCAQVYHKDHMPQRCLHCEQALGEQALSA